LAYNQHHPAYPCYANADTHNYDLLFAAASLNAVAIIHVDGKKVMEEKSSRFIRSQCRGCVTPD